MVLSKHDSNNLEVKLDFSWNDHLTSETSAMEVICILPNNLSLKGVGKTELWSDFRSRSRLVVPNEEVDTHRTNLLHANADALNAILSSGASDRERLLQAVQSFGYQTSEYLKRCDESARKALFLVFSLLNTANSSLSQSKTLIDELMAVSLEINQLRSTLDSLKKADESLFFDCSEYIHFQYVRFLSSITTEFGALRKPGDISDRLQKTLEDLCLSENAYAKVSGIHDRVQNLGGESECLIRMSTLKRFFHSGTFVHATREEYIRRFSEPLASGAALFAASLGAVVQRVSEPGIVQTSAGSLGLISLGVFLYVFRDRVKDRGRAFFMQWLGRRVPELRDALVFRGKKVGMARKWLQVQKFLKLPSDVIELRRKLAKTKLESEMNPEALCYKEVFTNEGSKGSLHGQQMHHILRINFRRFLKFMDDSKKEISVLSSSGKIETREVPRLYPFYIFVRKEKRSKLQKNGQNELFAYRALVSKDGIQVVESLEPDTRNFGSPCR